MRGVKKGFMEKNAKKNNKHSMHFIARKKKIRASHDKSGMERVAITYK